jgi:serine/threonine protein kinase
MSFSLGNRISSGSFGDVYKVKAYRDPKGLQTSSGSLDISENKLKETYALKVIQNTHYGIRCLTELFILLFLNYSYIMNSLQFHIDLKERNTKILMPLATCDFKSGLLKYIRKKVFHNSLHVDSKDKDVFEKTLWQIVCALGFLHSKGIVHGDIKPSNILLCGSTIKLTDFSLSTFHTSESHRIHLKESYTENYRPPEVWNGQGYTYKGDIWALGCTFHEIVYNKKYILDISSKDLQEEKDVHFKNLMEGMLNLKEEHRLSVWDVLNHDYFKESKKDLLESKHALGFELNYPNTSKDSNESFKGFASEEDFVQKLMKLTTTLHQPDIPKYVYDIIAMKLFRRTIDKSHFKYLDIFYIEYETRVIELLWKEKLGFELFK